MRRLSLVSVATSLLLIGTACSDDPDADSKPVSGDVAADISEGDATVPLDSSGDTGTPDDAGSDGGSIDVIPDDFDGGPPGGDDTGDTTSDGGSPPGDTRTDTGLDCVEGKDDDSDGLTNCDEIQMCTDPNEGDTDDDGLGDLEEIQNQTDPCEPDTDDDGVNDRKEIQLGLDPNRASTYSTPQKIDSERWFVDHCDTPDPEPVDYYEDNEGNWTIALPPTFGYTPLDVQKPGQHSLYHAAAVYDDPTLEVTGALFSINAPSSQTSPLDALDVDTGEIHDGIKNMGNIDKNVFGAEFTTHNEKPAATNEYQLILPQKASPRQLRDDLLMELADIDSAEIQPPGLPNSAGAEYSKYQVRITVIHRRHPSGKTTNLVALGLAPLEQYNSRDKVEFRLDDLTNTTNIADAKDTHKSTCLLQKPPRKRPQAEFYWVLDQSGSMRLENSIIRNFSSQFENKLRNTQLDFRLGVTNMDDSNKGRLYLGPGWHTNSDTFSGEIQDRAIECTGSNWGCDGAEEKGLEAATEGLRFMQSLLSSPLPTPAEEIRSNADIYSIFMTDEGPQGSDREPSFLTETTKAFALTPAPGEEYPNNPDCGPGPTEPTGEYADIALRSGGKWADLCADSDKLTQFVEEVIKTANRRSSPFDVGETPISVSLRTFLNNNEDGGGGRWVPRSTDSGFDYSPSSNTLAFFGDYRPQFDPPRGTQPDWIGINFQTYKLRCKDVLRQEGVNTCGLPSDTNSN